jgi:DNA-binding FadR family transcriptional regulator
VQELNDEWPRGDEGIEIVPAYDVVARRLRRAIHLGELPPGSKLPPERSLSQRLGVSRITLREAIRVLEGEGYVEVGRGSHGGTKVRSGSMPPDEVRSWMRRRWPELEALFHFRRINEVGAAERAAERASKRDAGELKEIAQKCGESADVNEFRNWDVRFHLFIADLADSAPLRRSVEEARAELYVPFRAIPLEKMLATSRPQHLAIANAIENGDPRRAGKAMEKHLNSTAEQMSELAQSQR